MIIKSHRFSLRTVLAIAIACSALLTVSTFVTANASSDDVSPTDVTYLTKQTEAPVTKTVRILREAPDLLLSNSTVKKPRTTAKFRGFLPSASYNGSYKSELDTNEKKLYEGLYDTYVVNKSSYTQKVSVDLDPPMTFNVVYSDVDNDCADDRDLADIDDAVLSAAAAFFYDCPEAFWIRAFRYYINSNFTAGSDVATVDNIQFEFEKESYPNAYNDLNAYNNGLNAAVNSITQSRTNSTAYETVKAIHDYICLNASYDYDAVSGSLYNYGYAYTAAPLFTGKGTFVCEGYSKAMKILCQQFGINCALVSGMGMTSDSYGGPHMWNYVQMPDGKWYGVDSTWDDAASKVQYNYFLVGGTTWVRSNKMFSQDHISDGQVMSVPTKFSMVYPPLSESAYDHYIVDTDPKITLTTLGASIRITDPYGIRFGIQIKRDEGLKSVHYIPEFGTLIIAAGTLGNNELTINTPNVRKIKASNIYSQDETQYTYTGVLINIPTSFFGTNVKGRGYLIYVDNNTGEEHIIYSETVERSFYGVAQAAYDSYSKISDPDDSQKAIIEKLKGFLNNR